MNNLKEIWKEKSDNKNITCQDVIEYCIIRAIQAKSENKSEIVKYFFKRAFTPSKTRGYDTPKIVCKYLYLRFTSLSYRSNLLISKLEPSEEELDLYFNLLKGLYHDASY